MDHLALHECSSEVVPFSTTEALRQKSTMEQTQMINLVHVK